MKATVAAPTANTVRVEFIRINFQREAFSPFPMDEADMMKKNGSIPAHSSDDDVLYKDKFCKLTSKDLVIYTYYFPIGLSLKIPLDKITNVWNGAEYGLTFMDSKAWGMAMSPIWWACDLGRHALRDDQDIIIVEVRDETLFKGFTCLNQQEFLSKLRPLLSLNKPKVN